MPLDSNRFNIRIKSHACEEGGPHLFLVFTDELEKQRFIKKTIEVRQ